MSRLAVVYVTAICISLSWHELWTSGLKWRNFTLVEDEIYPDYQTGYISESTFFEQMTSKNGAESRTSTSMDELKCSKNIINSQLISIVHLTYFVILFGIYFALLILSKLVWLRLRNVKMCIDFLEGDDDFLTNDEEAIDFLGKGM